MFRTRGIALLFLAMGIGEVVAVHGPTTPDWAVPRPWRKMRAPWGSWTDVNARNARRLSRLERTGPADIVMYGDSITAFHYGYSLTTRHPATSTYWKKHLGDLRAVPMAIAGDGIGTLVWRLHEGNEMPRKSPRAIVFLIGINDVLRGENVTTIEHHMRYLVEFVFAAHPTTHIVVCALTPVNDAVIAVTRAAVNQAYRRIVSDLSVQGILVHYVDMLKHLPASQSVLDDNVVYDNVVYDNVFYDNVVYDRVFYDNVLYDRVHLSGTGHDRALRSLRRALNEFIRW